MEKERDFAVAGDRNMHKNEDDRCCNVKILK
jgi:hypothetical protein